MEHISLSREDVIAHIQRAEALYKANLYTDLQAVMTIIKDNLEALDEDNYTDYARYYRLYMLYISVFEDINIPVLESYLNALININEVQASDFEFVCSYYATCQDYVFHKALMLYPQNETLHIHYALKLQEEQRFEEAITTLKYILECYPSLTEARFLLRDIQAALLDQLCSSAQESDADQLLELASSTHNLDVLKGLQLDDRLDQTNLQLANIQVDLWENKSVEILKQWKTEWKFLDLSVTTQIVLADYAKAFMLYEMVAQIVKAPATPQFPEVQYNTFTQYQNYMQALVNAGWQQAQHSYVQIGNAAYYYTKNKTVLEQAIAQGLALNPNNPLFFVLKAKSFFLEANYKDTGAMYHAAFKNGLRTSEYLLYLLEVNSRIESWQGILDIVAQFHIKNPPTLKTLYFKARALVKLQQFDDALVVINDALTGFPLPPHSYAPWFYNLRMSIHKIDQNYDAFFEDLNSEIYYYQEGDSEYCSTINMAIEVLLEKEDYEECYKYAIYNHEQEYLLPELYPVFQWICFYDFLNEKPEDINDASIEDLIPDPITFTDYRNNGLIHWMTGATNAGADALVKAASLATNKAYYFKLALTCAKEGSNTIKSIDICEVIKTETPEAYDWNIEYDYANLLYLAKRYDQALLAFKQLLKSYPDHSFFNFPKDQNNMLLQTLKNITKALGKVEDNAKYNALFLSKDQPSVSALLEHLEWIDMSKTDALFSRHNILEKITHSDTAFENNQTERLKAIKSKISTTYFS